MIPNQSVAENKVGHQISFSFLFENAASHFGAFLGQGTELRSVECGRKMCTLVPVLTSKIGCVLIHTA